MGTISPGFVWPPPRVLNLDSLPHLKLRLFHTFSIFAALDSSKHGALTSMGLELSRHPCNVGPGPPCTVVCVVPCTKTGRR